MKRIIIIMLCVVFLFGCGSTNKTIITADGKPASFEDQKKACGGDDLSCSGFWHEVWGTFITVAIARGIKNKNFTECMANAGYPNVEACPVAPKGK